ncbi:MAG: transglutaminase domain-containing protein [Flavisolibacter sp.]
MHSIFNFKTNTTRVRANEVFYLPYVKVIVFIFGFITLSGNALSQKHGVSFSRIDWEVQSVEAATVDSLSYKLVHNYSTELEKVRAIFSWITQHISYNTYIFNALGRYGVNRFVPTPMDTISEWKSANEMTAQRVLQRRFAICDGYAKLFKTLCDYAGIRSELVPG